MLIIGIAFAVFAALIKFVGLSVVNSAFLVGIALIVFGFLIHERLN